ncbi:polysaccharide pyruvyl transferase family protein [Curtobacterium oceanosedimentum]|uniref:polysaccharide pyruvyl transferase family protein n=1 Tax=Curtobacterium oceanosedimentum TaxID=465820 RepID=UPI00339B5B94
MNAYSYRNAGDAAIMLSTARLVRDLGATSVAIASRYEDGTAYGAFGLRTVPPIIPFPSTGDGSRLRRGAVLALGSVRSLVSIATHGRIGAKRLRAEYDSVVIAGGGYMYSSKRRVNMSLWHSLLSAKLGSAVLGRTLMMPQSVGPINRRIDRAILEWALREVPVVVRETQSLDASHFRPRLKGERVIADVAFYPGVDIPPHDAPSSRVLRLVAMDWTWSTSVEADRFDDYLRRMAELVDLAVDAGFRVVLGGHSSLDEHDQDDIRVAEQIRGLARRQVQVDSNADVAHLYGEYQGSTVVVGTRLHSCIMALSVGTPAIGLSYQEKTVGVLEGVGHGAYVHKVDDFDPEVVMGQVLELASSESDTWAALAKRTKDAIRDGYEELAR